MIKQTIIALALMTAPAAAHELTFSEDYPGLEGYHDGVAFRPIGVEGPKLPEIGSMFEFIQASSPVETSYLSKKQGTPIFNIKGITAPEVRYLTDDMMIAFGGAGFGAAVAIYEEGYMYLNTTIDFDNAEDLSVLFHELVHHVQWYSGENEKVRYQACPMHLERDAYRIQLEWMETQPVSDEWVYAMEISGKMSGDVICYPDRPFG